MINNLLTVLASVNSPESIASIVCGALVPVVAGIIALIRKKIKPGSKEERIIMNGWKFMKDMFLMGKKVGEEECKAKNGKASHKASGHPKRDGKKT